MICWVKGKIILDGCSIYSDYSSTVPKEIYYFQPKIKGSAKLPTNIPRLDIQSIPPEEETVQEEIDNIVNATMQTPDSNLNKAFQLSGASIEVIKQQEKFSMEYFDFDETFDKLPRPNFNKSMEKNNKEGGQLRKKNSIQIEEFSD